MTNPESLQRKVPDPVPGSQPEELSGPVSPERRQELERIVRSSPNDSGLFLELASIYLSEHRPLEAKRVLDQALQIFPDDHQLKWHYEEALLARALQQFREANDLASRVSSAEADAELEKSQVRWVDCRIEVCTNRLRRDPSLKHLRVVLGEAYLDSDRYADCRDAIAPIIKEDSFGPQAYFLLGRCWLAEGEHVKAMEALRFAVMRREVPAPLKIRLAGLRLLVETAEATGMSGPLDVYRDRLSDAETELAAQSAS